MHKVTGDIYNQINNEIYNLFINKTHTDVRKQGITYSLGFASCR